MNSFTAQQFQSSQNRLPRRKKGADCFNLTSIVNIMDHINRSVQKDHTGLGCGCSRKKKGFSSLPQYRSLQVAYFTDFGLTQHRCLICSSFFKSLLRYWQCSACWSQPSSGWMSFSSQLFVYAGMHLKWSVERTVKGGFPLLSINSIWHGALMVRLTQTTVILP